ncbi:MAG TPA: hypothetical protein DCG75_06410 [Bacteroidales bacterium]|nr:hypothetical protein [Bacteroidales bacterium]
MSNLDKHLLNRIEAILENDVKYLNEIAQRIDKKVNRNVDSNALKNLMNKVNESNEIRERTQQELMEHANKVLSDFDKEIVNHPDNEKYYDILKDKFVSIIQSLILQSTNRIKE